MRYSSIYSTLRFTTFADKCFCECAPSGAIQNRALSQFVLSSLELDLNRNKTLNDGWYVYSKIRLRKSILWGESHLLPVVLLVARLTSHQWIMESLKAIAAWDCALPGCQHQSLVSTFKTLTHSRTLRPAKHTHCLPYQYPRLPTQTLAWLLTWTCFSNVTAHYITCNFNHIII